MVRQVEGVRTASQTNKMVIIPASAAVADGLTFTVGQITWTTHDGGLTTTTLEETQIQSGAAELMVPITPTTITTTPRARPPLPRYKGKWVDNSNLLEAIDRADHKLLEASNLVDSISCMPDQAPVSNFFRLPSPNSCHHAWTTGDVLDDNFDHQGMDCQAQDSLARREFSSWSEQHS